MTSFDWNNRDRQFISVEDTLLEVRTWGSGPTESTTIVLLHEGLGCIDMWRDFPEKLATRTGCGVLAYSRAGYGRSSPCALPRPLDYMEREAADVLPRIIDAAGIERVILAGHSDGASIAALYHGNQEDDRVLGLVLMAPHFFVEELSVESIRNARTIWEETDFPQRLGRYHADVENAFLGWNNAWLDSDFLAWNIEACIDGFKSPCLALQGSMDEYGTRAQVDVIAQRSPARVQVHLLEECEHSPHKDQPEAVLSLVAEFSRGILQDPAEAAG